MRGHERMHGRPPSTTDSRLSDRFPLGDTLKSNKRKQLPGGLVQKKRARRHAVSIEFRFQFGRDRIVPSLIVKLLTRIEGHQKALRIMGAEKYRSWLPDAPTSVLRLPLGILRKWQELSFSALSESGLIGFPRLSSSSPRALAALPIPFSYQSPVFYGAGVRCWPIEWMPTRAS